MNKLPFDVLCYLLAKVEIGDAPYRNSVLCSRVGRLHVCRSCVAASVPCTHLLRKEMIDLFSLRLVCKCWNKAIIRMCKNFKEMK